MEFTFKHSKTFRYEIINGGPEAKTVLYVLHGYGQLVKHFIPKFNGLPKDLMIVAPEGTHRFYLKGSSGRVGASWMTKEIRQIDIEDNINWLNALDDEICSTHPVNQRHLLGFSQGGSTAIRWYMFGKPKFNSLIVWAADFPPDEKINADKLTGKNNYFVIGSEDEFYSRNDQQQLMEEYQALGFKISPYIGMHDINETTLTNILGKVHKN